MSDDKRGHGRGQLVAWLRDGLRQVDAEGASAAPGIGVDRLGRARPSATAVVNADGVWQESVRVQGVTFELIWVPPGEFWMGSPEAEKGRGSNEVRHRARLTRGFWLGKYPVTQRQWAAVMGTNPSRFTCMGLEAPVEQVSWDDCQKLIRKLTRAAGPAWRLPTEAEWEYACRAGSATAWCVGDGEGALQQAAWYAAKSGGTTHPVGQLRPNGWGLYEMHGNVWERVQDWYGEYGAGARVDPTGPSGGSARVIRGGSWDDVADACRSAYRICLAPGVKGSGLGVRLARVSA